jgi:hypothetical protein
MFLLQNFMNIDGTTLKSFCWFLRLSAGPQKLEHKVDHNYSHSKNIKTPKFKRLVQIFHIYFLKKSMFEASEALQKPEGTNKIKTTLLHS